MYEVGDRVGKRYEIIYQIGAGAMGVVYCALDRLTGQQVALKHVLTPHDEPRQQATNKDSQEYRIALAQEFKTLASLRHPHIISVLDYGFDSTGPASSRLPYYTMRLLRNAHNILEAAQDAPFEVKIRYLVQMLQALMYLHRRGILHRDLKPANIYIAEDSVKVLDFGLATARGRRQSQEVVGTLAYMAPELLQGVAASIASDLYAVGVLAYQMIAGQHPFDVQNPTRLIEEITLKAADVSTLDVPPPVAQVIKRLLHKSPQQRYLSAREVILALSAAVRQPIPPETEAIRDSFLQAAEFVGRNAELERLLKAMRRALKGQGSAWLIGGESGVGKSRLLDELRTRALVNGALVLRGEADAEGRGAFGLWRQIVRWLLLITDHISDEEASVLKWLLPDIDAILSREIASLPVTTPQGMQKRLISTMQGLLLRQSQPVLIILDDLHWALESLEILRGVAQNLDAALMIVASYRSDEHPTLPEQAPWMHHMHLKRLDDDDIARLSYAMLGDVGLQAEVLDLIHRETEGNVFFIVEVVRALAEEAGDLESIGETTLPEQVFAGGMQQLVQRRLERIPQAAYPLLEAAAVQGRYLDLRLLHHLQPQVQINQWLMTCANCAVLEVYEDQWRFVHDKLRDGLLRQLEAGRKSALNRHIAEAIEALYADSVQEKALLLAHHWQQAGDAAKERHYARLAGDQMLRSSAFNRSIAYYKRALELTPAHDPLKVELLTQLGDVCTVIDYHAAKEYLRQAAFYAREAGDRHRMARALTQLGRLALVREGDLEQAQFYQQEALIAAHAANDPIGMALVLWQMGNYCSVTGDYERAYAYLLASIEAARADPDGRLHSAAAMSSLSNVLSKRGDFTEALMMAGHVQAAGEALGNPRLVMLGIIQRGYAALLQADYETAHQDFQQASLMNQQVEDQEQQGKVANYIGECLLRLKRYAQAQDAFKEALYICLQAQLLPEMLKALSGVALVWYYADPQARKTEALELLTMVLSHPVCNQETYEFRVEVMQSLHAELPPAQIKTATEKGLHYDLKSVAQHILMTDSLHG